MRVKAGTVRVGAVTSDLHGQQAVTYVRPRSRWLGQMYLSGDKRIAAQVGERVRLEWTGSDWKCEVLGRAWPP
jgi:hypothetical protein